MKKSKNAHSYLSSISSLTLTQKMLVARAQEAEKAILVAAVASTSASPGRIEIQEKLSTKSKRTSAPSNPD